MATVADRYDAWVDLVWQYLHGPVVAFPTGSMSDALAEAFSCALVSWNQGDVDQQRHQVSLAQPIDGWPTQEELTAAAELMKIHPLLCWYTASQDPKPLDLRSVPKTAVPRGGHELVTEMLSHVGVDHQLAVPAQLSGGRYQTFVMGRPDDFTDEELDLAGRIQPLLAIAVRHASVVTRTAPVPTPATAESHHGGRPFADVAEWAQTLDLGTAGADVVESITAMSFTDVADASRESDLTCREQAVLRLLAEGGTAHRIGRQLGISPRTVHTHLGNIYRKLDVDGRVTALLEARRRGLISW